MRFEDQFFLHSVAICFASSSFTSSTHDCMLLSRESESRECFMPSQPETFISGLRETLVNRKTDERTNKAEIRPEEQREKAESCRESLWNEIQLKGLYKPKQA